ncbi:MAG TPA: hypothetical protein DCW90_21995 [Lachnospiraceae bacterium]|nr:hypothetical protein [uncultured Lachnoclostridium sp.]HAU88046.1 hypothetical protein [Lachnospiraceae bacterium]
MKRTACMLIMMLSMLLLTACSSGEASLVQMNADGTGSMGFAFMVDEESFNECAELGGSAYVKQLEKLGFVKSTESFKGEKYVNLKKTVEFKTTDELKKLLTDAKSFSKAFFNTSSNEFIEDALLSSCKVTTTTFHGTYTGSLDRHDVAGDDDDDILDDIHEFSRMDITFPNEIVDTNGTKGEDGKTVSWVFEECLNDKLLKATIVGKQEYPKDTKKPVIYGAKNGAYYRCNGDYDDAVQIRLSDDIGIKKATVNGKLMGNEEYFYNDAQYNVTAYDYAGNVSKITFYIDSTKPTISGVTNGKYYNQTKTIKFSDKRGVKSATLNGKAVKSGTKVGRTGKYTLKVTDKAGNIRQATFVIDKVNPTITGVTNGKTYRSARTIKFSDQYGVKTATLNGNTIRSGKKVSRPGKYTVRVTDKSGNIRTVKFTIKK